MIISLKRPQLESRKSDFDNYGCYLQHLSSRVFLDRFQPDLKNLHLRSRACAEHLYFHQNGHNSSHKAPISMIIGEPVSKFQISSRVFLDRFQPDLKNRDMKTSTLRSRAVPNTKTIHRNDHNSNLIAPISMIFSEPEYKFQAASF